MSELLLANDVEHLGDELLDLGLLNNFFRVRTPQRDQLSHVSGKGHSYEHTAHFRKLLQG